MKGIGVDIVEISRIKAISKREKFVGKILSEQEKSIYVNLKSEKRQLEYLAGRFAMKEAIYKAAPHICKGKQFTEFSILNDETGAPYLEETMDATFMMTLSHSENYVVAFAVCT